VGTVLFFFSFASFVIEFSINIIGEKKEILPSAEVGSVLF